MIVKVSGDVKDLINPFGATKILRLNPENTAHIFEREQTCFRTNNREYREVWKRRVPGNARDRSGQSLKILNMELMS